MSALSDILGHRVGMFYIFWVFTNLKKGEIKGQLKSYGALLKNKTQQKNPTCFLRFAIPFSPIKIQYCF